MEEGTFYSNRVKAAHLTNRARAQGQGVTPCLKQWHQEAKSKYGSVRGSANSKFHRKGLRHNSFSRPEMKGEGLLWGQIRPLFQPGTYYFHRERKAEHSCRAKSPTLLLQDLKGGNPFISIQVYGKYKYLS